MRPDRVLSNQIALRTSQWRRNAQAARWQFPEKLNVFLLMTTTQTATINKGRITEVAVALA
jgi:hypothetical protein